MNRILFDRCEIKDGYVSLTDFRAAHIRNVLKSEPGHVLKTGEVNGRLSEGTVIEVSSERITLKVSEHELPDRPGTDLILALPRPKVLNRLLPQISALGVDRIVLCNASKVERYYFDTHILDAEHIKERLIEGLVQSGDTCLPEVRVMRQLRHFLEDEVEIFSDQADRWILHPGAKTPLMHVEQNYTRTVMAIGPEGGWLNSEVDGFTEHGFQPVSLMNRILRSDTATIAALSAVAMRNRSCS